MVIAILLF